jgi:FkbM family methyltransferase
LLLREEDTFVDVGGNEGYFSVVASSLTSNGNVYCIEPQTRLQKVIRENLRLNNFLHAQLHHLAFSSSEGNSFLYLRPTTISGASSQFPHWRFGSQRETIVTVTMDSFFRENLIDRVRLLKMDCEGAEGEIVNGAQVTLQKHVIDFIALEYHPTICGVDRCLEIDNKIRACGYQLAKIQGHHVYHIPGNEKVLESLGGLQVNCSWDT